MVKLHYKDYNYHNSDNVSLVFRSPQEPFPEHDHDDFNEIVIVDSGHGLHVLNDHPYIVHSGMVFYIKAHDHHLFEQVNNLHLVNILYRHESYFSFIRNFTYLLPNENDSRIWCISPSLKKEISKLIYSLNTIEESDPLVRCCYKENLFLQLLLLLRKSRYKINKMESNQNKLQQLLIYLQQNGLDSFNWDELAEQFYLTPRTFHRLFIKQTGLTPQKYVNQLKLHRARYLLKTANSTLTDIAIDCGFSNSSNFSTLFKKEFGLSPSQMRTLIGKKQ